MQRKGIMHVFKQRPKFFIFCIKQNALHSKLIELLAQFFVRSRQLFMRAFKFLYPGNV